MYTDIVDDKIELVNGIGELFDGVINHIHNEADMVDNMKLARILERWRDDTLDMFNRSNAYSKSDNKPDIKKKYNKPDTKQKDNKPDTKKIDKPDIKKKDKPDIEKHRKVLKDMICEKVHILLTMQGHLLKSTKNICMEDNQCFLMIYVLEVV